VTLHAIGAEMLVDIICFATGLTMLRYFESDGSAPDHSTASNPLT
jgi:hypothetical protein